MASRTCWHSAAWLPVTLGVVLAGCAKGEEIARPDRANDAAVAESGTDAPTQEASTPDAPAGDATPDAPAPPDAAPCDAVLTINEVQPAGPAGPDDEFVEIHNPGDCALSVEGYTLFYRSDDGTEDHLVWSAASGQTMQPGQFFVVGGKDFTGGADFPMGPNVALGASGGGLGLEKDDVLVDSMGWGDATNAYVEGSAAPAPSADRSVGRFPDGTDTGNNGADFVELSPSPRKSNNAW